MARNHLYSEDTVNQAFTAEQRASVLAELELIVSDPIFRSSNRCVALLRYVVIRTLDNGREGLREGFKERLLGIEVFGRSPDYDVAADPIVRRVSNEIRKRLAQYYQEAGSDWSVRIRLDRGGYLPEFEFPPERTHQEPGETERVAGLPDAEEYAKPVRHLVELSAIAGTGREDRESRAGREGGPGGPGWVSREKTPGGRARAGWRLWIAGIAAAVLVAVAGLYISRLRSAATPESRIWKPLLDASDTMLVALPIRSSTEEPAQSFSPAALSNRTAAAASPDLNPSTLFRDVYAGTTITTQLSKFKKGSDLRPSTALTFRDFQEHPAVLIGGLNNPWVATFLSGLRYTLEYDPVSRDAWVQDSQNPGRGSWTIDGKLGSADPPADYAVITRVFNRETAQWMLALSGLQAKGTQAAAELVADPRFAGVIPAAVSGSGNFQIVLKTSVLGGEPGPLQVLAVATW